MSRRPASHRPEMRRPGIRRPEVRRPEVSRPAVGDRGSATVWAAGLIAVLLLLGAVGVDLASAVRARHVAGAAADLSALAAAGVASEGQERACTTARATAEANGARLRECRLDGWDALVEIEVDRGWTLVGRGPAGAVARAGPAPLPSADITADVPESPP